MSQSEFWIAGLDQESKRAITISRILEKAGYPEPRCFPDPGQALTQLESLQPALVIFDLDTPDLAELAFIRRLKSALSPGVFLPILAIGEVSSPKLAERAVDAGANDFLAKPLSSHNVLLYVGSLLRTSGRVRYVRHFLDELLAITEPEPGPTLFETIARLGQAAELSDDETGEHAARVGRLSGDLAHELGLLSEEVQLIVVAAPLHDLGKAFVADRILSKKGYYATFERKLMQQHVQAGVELLKRGSSGVMREAEIIARSHHERWDGNGYPGRLAGVGIPLPGRIVAVAEAFEAMTHLRPHKNAAPVGDALAELRRERGRQFDPDVVDALLRIQDRLLCLAGQLFEGWASHL